MHGKQIGRFGLGVELAAQLVGWPVLSPARVVLKRNDILSHEAVDVILEFGQFRTEREIHRASSGLADGSLM